MLFSQNGAGTESGTGPHPMQRHGTTSLAADDEALLDWPATNPMVVVQLVMKHYQSHRLIDTVEIATLGSLPFSFKALALLFQVYFLP